MHTNVQRPINNQLILDFAIKNKFDSNGLYNSSHNIQNRYVCIVTHSILSIIKIDTPPQLICPKNMNRLKSCNIYTVLGKYPRFTQNYY